MIEIKCDNPYHVRLHEAEDLVEKFMKLAMQMNHCGKNPACPICQVTIDALSFAKKYYDPEKMIQLYGEEAIELIESIKKNPKKYLFS